MLAIRVKEPVRISSVQLVVVSDAGCTLSRSDCGRHLQYTASKNQHVSNENFLNQDPIKSEAVRTYGVCIFHSYKVNLPERSCQPRFP